MGEADSRYLDRYYRSTVARWESGEISPTKERIDVFGEALGLSPVEIEGTIRLAGLDSDDADQRDETQGSVEPVYAAAAVSVDTLEHPGPGRVMGAREGDSPTSAGYTMRYALSRFLVPGSCVALAGYALASLGWNNTFMLAVYVTVAMCLLCKRRSNNVPDGRLDRR